VNVGFPDNSFLIQLAQFVHLFDYVNMLQQHASSKDSARENQTAFEKDVEASRKKSVSAKPSGNTGLSYMAFGVSGNTIDQRRQVFLLLFALYVKRMWFLFSLLEESSSIIG